MSRQISLNGLRYAEEVPAWFCVCQGEDGKMHVHLITARNEDEAINLAGDGLIWLESLYQMVKDAGGVPTWDFPPIPYTNVRV